MDQNHAQIVLPAPIHWHDSGLQSEENSLSNATTPVNTSSCRPLRFAATGDEFVISDGRKIPGIVQGVPAPVLEGITLYALALTWCCAVQTLWKGTRTYN